MQPDDVRPMTWEEVERLEKYMDPDMTDKYRRSVAGRAIAAWRLERERAEGAERIVERMTFASARNTIEMIALKARADKLAEAVKLAMNDVAWVISKPQNINGVFSADPISEEHYRLTPDGMSKLDDVQMDLWDALRAYRAAQPGAVKAEEEKT